MSAVVIIKLMLGGLGLAYVGLLLTVTVPSQRQINELMNATFNPTVYYILAAVIGIVSVLLLRSAWKSFKNRFGV